MREEKPRPAEQGFDSTNLSRAETFEDAPLTAPLFQGELAAGLRGF